MTKGISLADLDASKASDAPFKFEYVSPAGDATGVILHVLGDESPRVQAETQKLLNERRKKEAQIAAQNASGVRADEVVFTPIEDDMAFGQRLTAVRLVGWDGITEPWSPELALQLIRTNGHLAKQVTAKSGTLANFMPRSPKA